MRYFLFFMAIIILLSVLSVPEKILKPKITLLEEYPDGTQVYEASFYASPSKKGFSFVQEAHADTFNPAAGAVSPMDGHAAIDTSQTTWAGAHDAATGQSVTVTQTTLDVLAGRETAGKYGIHRAFVLFDTSSIPDNAAILTTTLTLKGVSGGVSNGDNDGNDYVVVATSSPASTDALLTTDYSKVGTTALSNTIDYGSWNDSGSNVLTFNATGLLQVSLTGISSFALREGHDMVNNEYDGADTTLNAISPGSADQAGTTNDPLLTVTYTVGGTSGGGTPEIKLGL